MKPTTLRTLLSLALLAIVVLVPASCRVASRPAPTATAPTPTAGRAGATPTPRPATPAGVAPAPTPAPPTAAIEPATPPGDPFGLISQESLFASLNDLVSIRPYAGWRSSATPGEAEALDYVATRLKDLAYLQGLGLELERQEFRVFLSTELRETRLRLTIDGRQVDVPANGLRGSRDDVAMALAFDSDGKLNDSNPNPMVVEAPTVLIRTIEDMGRVKPEGAQGKVIFLDYALVDRSVARLYEAGGLAWLLLSARPAGLVLVTQYSDRSGESHGTFAGEGNVVSTVKESPAPPVLYTRLEDLEPAGIAGWDDLARVQSARLSWDADVFSPANSGNLVARIPGADASQAVILGAHVDSPNGPGAMDDGSGAAVLLEVARVLDAARLQPPVDLYLVWFGSEELGLYGSAHFAATHQELLDRTLAMLQVDCLTRPLGGMRAQLDLATWSYGHMGDGRLAWPDYLVRAARERDIAVRAENLYEIDSDNGAFAGYGVPNANLSYIDFAEMAPLGLHYAAHIHDPYDTVTLARDVAEPFEQMARIALLAALQTGHDRPDLRVARPAERRAVFVASHTEPGSMGPSGLLELGLALTWEGFDVDVVPYGQAVTAGDLAEAALVFALPVVDYPGPAGSSALYDEAWSPEEIAALEAYVAGGGLLILANSANRLTLGNQPAEANEDWSDANPLAARFGVSFLEGTLLGRQAEVSGSGALVASLASVTLAEGNGVPFEESRGEVLAHVGDRPAMGLIDHGRGQVLVLADVGMLGGSESANLRLWRNLARHARSR